MNMNIQQILVAAAAAAGLAFAGTFNRASAQALPATARVVHGATDAHDLQLSLSEGRRHADATGVKVTITDPAGRKVLSLDDAGALTDVDLPPGHYHVLAEFGRVKRMGAVDVQPGEVATLHLHGPGGPG